MHSINGYVFGNQPLITMRRGERVRWYVMSMGTEVDLHTPHWHGNDVTVNGMRMDVVSLLPAGMVVADMVPGRPGHLAVPLPRQRPHHRRDADPLPGGGLTPLARSASGYVAAWPTSSTLIYEDHDWLRRRFFYLDDARTDEELAASGDLSAPGSTRTPRPRRRSSTRCCSRWARPATPRTRPTTRSTTTTRSGTRSGTRSRRVGHQGVVRGGRAGAHRERRAPRRGGARGASDFIKSSTLEHAPRAGHAVVAVLRRPPGRSRCRRPRQGPRDVHRGEQLSVRVPAPRPGYVAPGARSAPPARG